MFTLLIKIVVCCLQNFGATKLNAFSISEVKLEPIYWVFPTKSKSQRSFMMKPNLSGKSDDLIAILIKLLISLVSVVVLVALSWLIGLPRKKIYS